jgi:5' nucleotidase, deoxy (Pyrimidine), cytosolic type C protein (NT5C)
VKIQVDVDGVLADFMLGAYQYARTIDPTVPFVDTLTTKDWDHWEGWQPDTVKAVWAHIKESPIFFFKLRSLIGKAEWRQLGVYSKPGHELYFVTSRPGVTAKWQTESWIYDQMERQGTVVMTADKAGFAKLIKPDFSIEDNAKNASLIGEVIGANKSFILDRLYNRNLHPQSATRVKTFEQFLERLHESNRA